MKAVKFGAIVCFLVGTTIVCKADQPACTGDRHYDGVACCPYIVDPPTTTTTLVNDPSTCTCPDVVCQCGTGETVNNTVVTVNRCPEFPLFASCRRHKKFHKGDVEFKGAFYRCPRPGVPHRFIVPQP